MANGKGPQRSQGPRSGGSGAGSDQPRRTPLQRLLYWGTVTFVWGLIFLTTIFFVFAKDLPDISRLYDVKRQPTISYLDRSGALIAVRGSQSAPPVDLAQLPAYVPDAFIAIEDRRFYYHLGFDPIGIMRAARNDIFKRKKGENLSGGSTITQLSEPGELRRRRQRHRGRRQALFRQAGQGPNGRRGRPARRLDQGSVPLQPGLGA
jgi:membrane peptidoglycan carboxypeptidase